MRMKMEDPGRGFYNLSFGAVVGGSCKHSFGSRRDRRSSRNQIPMKIGVVTRRMGVLLGEPCFGGILS